MRIQLLFAAIIFLLLGCTNDVKTPRTDQSDDLKKQKLIERAQSFELDTKPEPVPGDPDVHHACGYAKVLCSAVFITGLDFDFAAEAIGYFSSPYEPRQRVAKRTLNQENRSVAVTLPDGTVRTAIHTEGQGCICLGQDEDALHFEPVQVTSSLPDAHSTPWPMGDKLDSEIPEGIHVKAVQDAIELAFEPAGGLTAAMVVSYKGQLIGEQYKDEITPNTALESWSMGKSMTAIMMGILIQQGVYTLDQPAPIPEWQGENDPRQEIKIKDIMRMSSGIRFRAPLDPSFDPKDGYPQHLYVYTSARNTFQYVAGLEQQWPPNTIGRYRNCDPVLTNYLIRLGVEGRGEDYLSFPRRALFDKIGVREMVMETDPYGNFLTQGYEHASARDWARLGNLVLNDGLWNGEQILYEGFLRHSMEVAPAWAADERPIYGGNFFWINGEEDFPIPKESIYMAGAGGQFTFIIPSHDLVVVRLGHYKGSSIGVESLKRSLRELLKVVPENK